MPLNKFYPSVSEAVDANGFSDDANIGNPFIVPRRLKSPEEATGIRVVYIGQGGIDPDGSSIDKWIYSLDAGWVLDASIVDTTRAAVIAYAVAIEGNVVASIVSDDEYSAIVAELV